MIEEIAPDAVYVIGPPDVMYPHWVWCLEHGLNLYIEKPMGITLHQARNLAYLAEKHGCITQVSFQRRTCPMVVELREECLKRGPIVHAVCRFYKNLIMPHLDARDHMMDDGVHAIDTLRWMCGGEVVGVESLTKRCWCPTSTSSRPCCTSTTARPASCSTVGPAAGASSGWRCTRRASAPRRSTRARAGCTRTATPQG